MKLLQKFIDEYNSIYEKKEVVYEKGIIGDIKRVRDLLLDDYFLPSVQLRSILDKFNRKARYPMEIAITGQFSSGKSTFLNALLSKDILPTGITPVTSKVNFINYGEEYKLKVTYKSGAHEYYNIDTIAEFTDQRKEELDDVKYLTLYAPMEILKDISFVDTPGLNSQSQRDTQTTKRVLRDVGGIIWLTLIDNAGKMSEAKVLKEYMGNFKDKSLCVLNQKDKFTKDQITTTTTYIKNKFGKYFSRVIPISAKQALDSRIEQKDILLKKAYETITNSFKVKLNKNLEVNSMDFLKDDFYNFKKEVLNINKKDNTNNINLLKQSNINEILDFIENIIRPQAKEAKDFSIRNDLRGVCDILIKEYEIIIGSYNSLMESLKSMNDEILETLNEIDKKYSKDLYNIYNSLESIMEKIANETSKNIQRVPSVRFQEKKRTFLLKNVIEKIQYDTFYINSDNIYKSLFYDDQTIDKMFKHSIKMLKNNELQTAEAFRDVYRILKSKVHKWQEAYEKIRKQREIASDLEFSNTRHFAAKVYENILIDFHRAILENISAIRKKFAYFNGALSYSYIQTTQATIASFEQQIKESEQLHQKDPTRFNITYPNEDEIFKKLKINFGFEKIEDFLTSKRNYLFKIVKYSKEQYLKINEDRIKFIKLKKESYNKKIKKLKDIKKSI